MPGVTFAGTIQVKLPNGDIVRQSHSEASFFDSVQEPYDLDVFNFVSSEDGFFDAFEDDDSLK